MGIARQLANGPRSLALIRRAYWETWTNAYEQQLDLESRLQSEAGRTSDFGEGVAAFLEKRDANSRVSSSIKPKERMEHQSCR